jgi:hypothetical protein
MAQGAAARKKLRHRRGETIHLRAAREATRHDPEKPTELSQMLSPALLTRINGGTVAGTRGFDICNQPEGAT